MGSHWVFIVKDHKLMGRTIPAMEVLKDRVKNKFWSLSSKARNVKKIKPGDYVLFYVTGKDGRGFGGYGVIATEPHPVTPEQRFHIVGMPSEAFDYAVDFSEAVVWDKPIALEELGDKLSILKGRRSLKIPFRGSIIKITEEDFQTVIQYEKPP